MNEIKTDIEIAADAIKYCRQELKKYNNLLSKCEDFDKEILSERTIAMWEYERQKLEYVLGLSDKRPIYPFSKEEIVTRNDNSIDYGCVNNKIFKGYD